MGSLGDFTPFLEVAFTINVLFSIWDGLYDKLSERLSANYTGEPPSTETVVLDDDIDPETAPSVKSLREKYEQEQKKTRRKWRRVGISICTGIALLLLLNPLLSWYCFFPDSFCETLIVTAILAVAGLALPLHFLVLIRRYKKYGDEIQNKRREVVNDYRQMASDRQQQKVEQMFRDLDEFLDS